MKVALVTGGARGIGLAVSRRLLADGFAVSIMATRPEPVEILDELHDVARAPGRVRYVQASVADLAAHERYLADAVDAWGRMDLLVNNAGVAPDTRADILDATPASFDRVLDVNLRGPYFLTQAFARCVIAMRGPMSPATHTPVATVVNVSSVSAAAVSLTRGEYCISKAGVAMATKLWATRLAPEGIIVHEVRPGVIATDMTSGVTERYDALLAGGLAPIARWGQPEDVASAVSMLATGQAHYSTGEVFHVDGGMHIPRL